jgi:hypothetical protein
MFNIVSVIKIYLSYKITLRDMNCIFHLNLQFLHEMFYILVLCLITYNLRYVQVMYESVRCDSTFVV